MNIHFFLHKRIQNILLQINIKKTYSIQILNNIKYGDYQIHGLRKIAIQQKINFMSLTIYVKQQLLLNNLINHIIIIPLGFLNIYINQHIFIKLINKYHFLNIFRIKTKKPEHIIIDYSSPNIAKTLHVGHLRSTIIGDCIANLLEYIGHKITRINHIGDWGTPLGILIAWIKLNKINKINNIFFLEKIYKHAQKHYIQNHKFAKLAHKYVVLLQQKKVKKIWKIITKLTIKHNQKIYKFLKIKLTKKNIIGESFYKNMLSNIITDLINKKIAVKDKKCIIIFPEKNEHNNIIIIKKKDGAYLYSTTDLACAKYRFNILKAQKIIYLTDFRQKQYFKSIFKILTKAKYIPKHGHLQHYSIGIILNNKGQPFSSRQGNVITLTELIIKTIKKIKYLMKKKNLSLYKKNIIHTLTIGTIKYMELSKNREQPYMFQWKKIISFKGNTFLYIQYAYVRIKSILKIYNTNITHCINKYKICSYNKVEFNILKTICNYPNIIKKTTDKGKPNILCLYLYEIIILFSYYYEKYHIQGNKLHIIQSRLKIISMIAIIIKIICSLLGIPILNKI